MQTTKINASIASATTELQGQFDALGQLGPDAWKGLSRWLIRKGRGVVTDVASTRDAKDLALLSLAFEGCAPRLA